MAYYDILGLRNWSVKRYGAGVSLFIVGFSGQRVKFVSDCENNIRITKTYFVVGAGLSVGLEASAWGGVNESDQSRGYFGETNFFQEDPRPRYGISVAGPSAGVGYKGATLASAKIAFDSYAEVYGLQTGRSLGLSIFDFQLQRYFYLGTVRERCCE